MENSRWLARVLIVRIVVGGIGRATAEEDHLKGYKIKDLNRVLPAANPYALANAFGNDSCELKVPLFFLVQSEKNGGDDPRGGPAGDFVCYKAKCSSFLPPVAQADSQFGVHQLESKKAKLVCLPVEAAVCGDGDVDPGEVCDGGDDSACPGNCQSDCTCAPSTCPTGGGELDACTAYGSFGSLSCYECCNAAGAACWAPCDATLDPVIGLCDGAHPSATYDACSSAINAAGCGSVCCP
jgi:hypothetical protein